MKVIPGGVAKANGFYANGLSCGIKRSGKNDLALIFCERPAATAGVFTKNSVKAAPLLLTKKHLRNNIAQAIIVNSGNANCFTGHFGALYAQRSTERIAKLLKVKVSDVLVASTGIIGVTLPYKKIDKAAPQLVKGLAKGNGLEAAKGMMTTDTFPKEVAVETTINNSKVIIGGAAKGSGMIEPNMATMLAFITTDADISVPMLKKALKAAVEPTFNSITVDGCMSTNDMVTVMANGLAGNKKIITASKDFKTFCQGLTYVCMDLAKKIVLDGEGATKFIEVYVDGAQTYSQAKQVAMKIANSNLVKTAAFGNNPNWGRVAGAVGAVGLNVNEKTLKIKFSSFAKKHIRIQVDLNLGKEHATVYTSDLSLEYVKINAEYN